MVVSKPCKHMVDWKFIRVKELGQFGESFNDIIKRLLVLAADSSDETTTRTRELSADEVIARLKKFNSHNKAISRLVKENVRYSPGCPERESDFYAGRACRQPLLERRGW